LESSYKTQRRQIINYILYIYIYSIYIEKGFVPILEAGSTVSYCFWTIRDSKLPQTICSASQN